MPNYKISNHLLIPFACEKWKIENIRVMGVSTEGTYFHSPTPLAYIDKTSQKPLVLENFLNVYDVRNIDSISRKKITEETYGEFEFIRDILISWTDNRSMFESNFLRIYFDYLIDATKDFSDRKKEKRFKLYGYLPRKKVNRMALWEALLPLPQAHLYLEDPLRDGYREDDCPPQNMVKVDFAFWDGEKVIAVEIDGSSHIGSERHITRDRELMRAGVEIIHILNSELLEFDYAIAKLLPKRISRFWEYTTKDGFDRLSPLISEMEDFYF